jgi:hypothetical protein
LAKKIGCAAFRMGETVNELRLLSAENWKKWETRLLGSIMPGTNVMILKIYFAEKLAEKLAFWTQNKDKLCKNLFRT